MWWKVVAENLLAVGPFARSSPPAALPQLPPLCRSLPHFSTSLFAPFPACTTSTSGAFLFYLGVVFGVSFGMAAKKRRPPDGGDLLAYIA